MGGYGSGQTLSHRWYLEDLRRVSIQEVIAKIGKLTGDKYITMKHGKNGGATVHVVYSSCNYGGSRAWFECPECGRRVGVLYVAMGRYACRKCWKLPYKSQSRGKTDRLYDRAYALESKIGGRERVRPKGMHWATYFKICDEVDRLRDLGLLSAAASMGFLRERVFGNVDGNLQGA